MGIYSIKPKFQKLLTPLTRYFVQNKIHPDVINTLGFLCAAIAGLSIYVSAESTLYLIVAAFFANIRLVFNALDGLVSRELKLSGPWGEMKNEVLDRFSDLIIFGAIALLPTVSTFLGIAVVGLTLMHSFVGVMSKAVGLERNYVGMMGKADRMLILIPFALAAYFVDVSWFGYSVPFLIVTLSVSIVQKLSNIHGNLS